MHSSVLFKSLLLIASLQLLFIQHVRSGIPLPNRQSEADSSHIKSRKLLQDEADENALKVLSNNRHKAPLFSGPANAIMAILFSLAMMSLLLFAAYVGYLKYRMSQIAELQEGERIALDDNEGEREPIDEQYLENVFRDQFSSLNKFPTISPSQCQTHSWNEIPITNSKEDNTNDTVNNKLTNSQPGYPPVNQSEHKKEDIPIGQLHEESIDVPIIQLNHEKSSEAMETEEMIADKSTTEENQIPSCSRSKSDPKTYEACAKISEKEITFFSDDDFLTADEGEDDLNLEDTKETGIKAWDKMRHALALKMRLQPVKQEEIPKPRRGRKPKAKKAPARRSGRK